MPESELSYGAAPLQKAPNRNQLWQEFQQQYMRRKSSLEAIRQKWAEKRKELEHRPIARRTRTNLMKLTRQYEAEELHAARMQAGGGNWLDFLRQEATKGDDAALAVLRSRQEEVAPETLQFVHERQQARSAYLASKTAVLEKTDLSARAKNRLVSMALMDSLASGATARISKHGSVIYTLPTGGKICDTGRSISFSPEARATALAYMSAKWNVKSRSLDRASGDTVYTLIGGQKVYERKGQDIFERPAVIRRHHQLERERNQSIGR